MSVYKPCDIRGDAAEELSPELYRSWGRVLGERLDPGACFVVGGDVRRSTPVFLAALIEGLCQAGMQVVDTGIAPTPMVYFARRFLQAPGCAVVTASHSPPPVNGLKWMVGDWPPGETEVQTLKEGIERGSVSGRSAGSARKLDLVSEYGVWLRQTWHREAGAPSGRVVLDPGNGCWAGYCLPCLEQVFPGMEFTAIHDRRDGAFADRDPDCARPAHLEALAEEVRRDGADLGIAFDGDGDRVAFVDDEGQALTAEQATWILLHSFGDALRGRHFVYDIKFSNLVPETAGRLAALPVVQKSGHAFIRTRMIEKKALFGAEISGHYFYQALEGGDDGLFTACRMIDFLAEEKKSLSALRRSCPPVWMTPDLRLRDAERTLQEVMQRFQTAFSHYPQTSVDGVRVDFSDGWVLFRKSVTEAAITCRFEGTTQSSLERIVREVCARIGESGRRLHQLYETERRGS